jgi:cyclic pyranopterin phosphate synthase
MREFSHLDPKGDVRMVDISAKAVVHREAIASGEILLQKATIERIESHSVAKGNVLATARIAGVLAAKRTSDLIPLCHPVALSHCEIDFEVPETKDRVRITATARCTGQTGVEMEALTAVAAAALTIYDMCKAVDEAMVVGAIRLVRKSKRSLSARPDHGQPP